MTDEPSSDLGADEAVSVRSSITALLRRPEATGTSHVGNANTAEGRLQYSNFRQYFLCLPVRKYTTCATLAPGRLGGFTFGIQASIYRRLVPSNWRHTGARCNGLSVRNGNFLENGSNDFD